VSPDLPIPVVQFCQVATIVAAAPGVSGVISRVEARLAGRTGPDILQRVIAYSSVENTGLILAGYGVALVGAARGSRELMAVGLLAATLQVVAHTAAKSLLFVSSAGIEAAGGSDDLDSLRGSVRLAPWSGTGLAVGSLTLAGLPPPPALCRSGSCSRRSCSNSECRGWAIAWFSR
jgi:NADH:ubiquinone oxidoreductase subunit 5 (subunit L)/multisubunit Na+/H+ antiporter MnhA subunit